MSARPSKTKAVENGCPACGRVWVDHAGVEATCRELQELRLVVARARAKYQIRGSAAEMFTVLSEAKLK